MDAVTERIAPGKTALVTGAGRRIGRQIAISLADQGMNVIVHFSTSRAEAEETATLARERGVEAWPIQADFGDAADLETFTKRCEESAGKVDVLVNSASIYPVGRILTSAESQFVENMIINTLAPLALCRWFAKRCTNGSIINILAARMDDYDPEHVPYTLSKQALRSLTRMLSIELAPGIRVNGVAPGLILPPEGAGDGYLEKLANTNPLKTWGSPEEISNAVIYLIGARFVTGQVIYVDGGRHLRGYTLDT